VEKRLSKTLPEPAPVQAFEPTFKKKKTLMLNIISNNDSKKIIKFKPLD
jgi:hypothetical protein